MAADDIREQIVKNLTDVHSTEENAASQLRAGVKAVSDRLLAQVLREHERILAQEQAAAEKLDRRLEQAALVGAPQIAA